MPTPADVAASFKPLPVTVNASDVTDNVDLDDYPTEREYIQLFPASFEERLDAALSVVFRPVFTWLANNWRKDIREIIGQPRR